MIIKFAPVHQWTKPITDDPISELGKSNRARIRSTLKRITNTKIAHEIEPLSQTTLDWFTPLYNNTISNKANPALYDIYNTTLGNDSGYKYYSLSLFEDGAPIGATIFSIRKDLLSIAYRIYPNKWESESLQANPSLYTEYLINKYGISQKLKKVSHGRDRNPYGINSQIGLAIFKLSVGCKPSIPPSIKDLNVNIIDTDSCSEDQLIFEYPTDSSKISKGYLITTEEHLSRYQQVTKYPNLIDISIILLE